MGLVFRLTTEEQKDTIDFLMGAFYGDSQHLFEKLKTCIVGSNETRQNFKNELDKYCADISNKAICNYFVDLMLVCFNYNIVPPNYLFKMAKSFIYLGGAEVLFSSSETGHELIGTQMLEYLLNQLSDTYNDMGFCATKIAKGVLTGDNSCIATGGVVILKDYNSIKSVIDKIIRLM